MFQCQFQGADEQTFVGGTKVGGAGTIPFGLNAPVSPPGSCPANPNGPIADGTQLVDVTQDPGVQNVGKSTGSANNSGTGKATGSKSGSKAQSSAAPAAASTAPPTRAASPPPSDSSSSSGSSFQLQNGQDAQALNAKFATLTASSSCNGTCPLLEDSFLQLTYVSGQTVKLLASEVPLRNA